MKISPETAKTLGLSKAETTILRALEKNELSISDLSTATGIPRTSLYYMLPKLQERGFVKKKRVNKKTIWEIAGFPLPQENSKMENYPQITTYFGADNLVKIFHDLSNTPKKGRIYGIQPKSSLIEAVKKIDLEEAIIFNERFKERNLIIEGVIHEKGTEEMIKVLPKENREDFLKSLLGRSADTVKLPENFLEDTKAEIYYYQDKVAIMNWYKEFGVVIENKDVFELFIEMFKSTKYMLEKYDQNEKIARMLVDE